MKRRSKDASKRAKARRPNASKSKHDSASKQTTRTAPSVASEQGEITQLGSELNEAREQQTATAGVLRMISRYPSDVHSILEAIVRIAGKLCEAEYAILFRLHDGKYHVACSNNAAAEFVRYFAKNPIDVNKESLVGRTALARRAVHIEDCLADPEYKLHIAARHGRHRTMLGVPLLHEGVAIGVIGLLRTVVKPFAKAQIELVTSFADQAVIAIENARLLNELRQRTTDLSDALEQQTATSEVLQIISSSPGDLEPVFTAILNNAVRICAALNATLWSFENDRFHFLARYSEMPGSVSDPSVSDPIQPGPNSGLGRVRATKQIVHITDYAAEAAYLERDPFAVRVVEELGIRTNLSVPMLQDNELVGAFSIYRTTVKPFSEKQIELIAGFAAQAVIAIENARLLNELRQRTSDLTGRTADLTEALEQQTATSEVLQVISSSPGDLKPVFATMLENSVRICDAKFGGVYRCDDDTLRLVATHNLPLAYAEIRRDEPFRPKSDGPLGRMVAAKSVVQYSDLASEPYYLQRDPATVAAVEVGGIRTVLAVPMLRENELIGILFLCRQDVRPFTERQIALVQNFANQAVIAIENARLLNELRDTTHQVQAQSQQLAKLNQQLEQRVADQVGEIERMSRLRRFLPPQVADLIVASGSEKQLESHRREITALFCDLRGFTGFTESADAEDVMALLRDYHAAIGEIIIKYNGTLERYAGDGVMVVFNDPVPVENPALQAVLMALEVRDAIEALTERWRRWGHDIGFGIGIAHGFATLGTIGFEGRFDYAAIGTVSNVASRLCDEAKPGQILISARVLTKVEHAVKAEPVGEFELKGIRRPLAAYNVVAALASKI